MKSLLESAWALLLWILTWISEHVFGIFFGLVLSGAAILLIWLLLVLFDPSYETKQVEGRLESQTYHFELCMETELYTREECLLLATGVE